MKRVFAFLYVTLSVLLSSCLQDDADMEKKNLQVGDAMPPFEVELCIPDKQDWRHDASTTSILVRSHELKGKTAIICFFNTKCEDCQHELPQLQKLYEKNRSDNHYAFLAIAREEKKKDIEDFWHQHNLTLPYSAQSDRRIYNLFATVTIPQFYVINEQGYIIIHENIIKMPF
ncbi:MAG: TlpA family protein disulfide reductase [Prevotellaceae bacterium]|nr:TlpA family protein disulfide reductase [Candidatus Minthosoma equi]